MLVGYGKPRIAWPARRRGRHGRRRCRANVGLVAQLRQVVRRWPGHAPRHQTKLASGSHRPHHIRAPEANSRFETTFWTTTSIGPPAGGLLISWLGPTITVAIDAVSFLASALGIRNLRTPEASPPVRTSNRRWSADLTGGWRYIFGHRGLNLEF
ncbi:MFS transporter [Micromonospora sp. NBC_00858]|nr:MFS transporter [Micromonospora sp. NBC_00858]